MSLSLRAEAIPGGLYTTRGADVDIAFHVVGSGPAVVLLHGTSANHAVWEPVGATLAGSATVISLDQRGHGRSSKPESGYDADDFARDVITVLDALGIDTAVVAGHSLGGRNAWVTAALFPDRIDGVLCVDYTPYVDARVLDDLRVRVARGHRRFDDFAAVKHYLRDRYLRILPDAVLRRARWGYRQDVDGTWLPLADPRAMEQLIEGFRTSWDEEFRAVTAPMTHIRGADSAIVSPAAWRAAIADRPLDRWIEAVDADHYVPEEHPDLIVREITRLLPQR